MKARVLAGTEIMTARTSVTSPVSLYSTQYRSTYHSDISSKGTVSSRYGVGSTNTSGARPLPIGRGPLDSKGRKVSTEESIKGLRSFNSSRHDTSGYSRAKPFKGDHTVGGGRTYSPSQYSITPPRSPLSNSPSNLPSTLTRPKHGGSSVSDIAARFERAEITETKTLAGSKRFGSTQDISSTLDRSTRRDRDSYGTSRRRDSSVDSFLDRTPRHDRDSFNTSTTRRRDSNYDTGVLPDISKSSRNTISDSPRSTVDKPQRRFSHQSAFNSYNGRSSPDNGTRLGLVGLRNLGNTCFMNSILQCLSNTKQLRGICLDDSYKNDINTSTSNMKGALVNAFAKLMKNIWKASNSDSHVSPTEFKSQIARFAKRFVGYNQQDAQEFLIYLLEGLHEDLNRVREKKKRIIPTDEEEEKLSAAEKSVANWKRYLNHDDSSVVDTFVGQLKSSLKCTVCGYVSNTFDPFWDLSLPIKKTKGYGAEVSLESCFELFTQEEVLDGDEKPTCAKCKKRQKCTKGFSIQKFPKVLIIHLKRFSQETLMRSKLSTFVNFRLKSLDLANFAAEKNGAPAIYNLYAVCNHSGTPYGGHYTSYVKHPFSEEWHHFNDTRVSSIPESKVVSSEGYVLFYELSGTSSRL